MKEIKTIYKPSHWLTSLKAGDVVVGKLLTRFSDQSFSVILARFNERHGQERNIFIHYHFKRSKQIMVLVCVSWSEHVEEYKKKKYEEDWKQKIPLEFRGN